MIELEIEGIVTGGEGIARHEGLAVFVPFAAPGDRVRAELISEKPSYARALIREIVEPGPGRIEPKCPAFGRCGGCQLQHLDYPAQLEAKRAIVQEAFRRIAHLDPSIASVLPGDPWHYRNKVHWAVDGKRIGLFEPRSHRIVEAYPCLIQHPLNNLVLDFFRRMLKEFPFVDLRSAFAKVGTHTDELMIGIVTRGEAFPQAEWVAEVRTQFPGVRAIVQNIHPAPGNALLGKKTLVLWGKDEITERLGDLTYAVSARSFFQVNSLQAEVLYGEVARLAGLTGNELVYDCFSGTGSIALFLAKHAREVVGIEEIPDATKNARRNAQLNGVENARFLTGLVEDLLPGMACPDAVILDPPRKGCEPSVLDTLLATRPRRVVYVSCNPATLARDAALLCAGGYRLEEVTPVDMFPQTAHVECVAAFSR
ncbi:MAG: 23S rRNA (uracil(1939)-C(5))-methyltransferase RlmD [Bacteroidota bacterium]